MADNNQNDEYHLSNEDDFNPTVLDNEPVPLDSESSSATTGKKNINEIKRNALIAVGLVIIVIIIFKLLGSLFTSKPVEKANVPPVSVSTVEALPPPINTPTQFQSEPAVSSANTSELTSVSQTELDGSKITQKLSVLEVSQQTIRSQMMTVNSQLEGVSASVNDLTIKMAALNQMIATLAAKVDQQAQTIALLTTKTARPCPIVQKQRVFAPSQPTYTYYIQAVIPGRAWLVASNGATLTVREGTTIAGYGTVKLIDPLSGRVVMSSGRVIRFSQQDS